jgi:hypothetical protein
VTTGMSGEKVCDYRNSPHLFAHLCYALQFVVVRRKVPLAWCFSRLKAMFGNCLSIRWLRVRVPSSSLIFLKHLRRFLIARHRP